MEYNMREKKNIVKQRRESFEREVGLSNKLETQIKARHRKNNWSNKNYKVQVDKRDSILEEH